MSESSQDKGQKTEKPTPKRLKDARKKGQVAKSEEVPVTIRFVVVTVFFLILVDGIFQSIGALIRETFVTVNEPFGFAMTHFLVNIKNLLFHYVVPFIIVMLVMLYLGFVVQMGVLFSVEGIKPSLKKLNPVQGVKNIFSKKKLFGMVKNIIRVVLLSVIFYYLLMHYRNSFEFLPYYDVNAGLQLLGKILFYIMLAMVIFSIVISVADFAFEKQTMMKQLMMSMDEIKKEFKETEGNPEIKAKRKEIHQEIQSGSLSSKVKKSSVVVRNPTEIAVCLYYEMGKTPLPVVIEKRRGRMARYIIHLAELNNVPVVTNVPIARQLYSTVGVNRFIGRELMAAVAAILRSVLLTEQQEDENGEDKEDGEDST